MRALITGGAGFIGSHLADFLIARGDTVAVVDDLRTGTIDNVAHLEVHPRFTCYIDSLANRPLMAGLIDQSDVVFHLATANEGHATAPAMAPGPARAISANISGTEMVLQLAAQKRRKVLLTSTSDVYGARTGAPLREDDGLLPRPASTRGWSCAGAKVADEFLALAYWEEHRVPVIVARLFHTIGPRQTGHAETMVARFVEAALAGTPITVYGDGRDLRYFAYVEDVVRILVGLVEHPDAIGQVINVGNDQEVAVATLAERIKARTGSASEIVMVSAMNADDGELDEPQRRVPDLSKLNRLLADPPRTGLDWILDAVIAHARTRRRISATSAGHAA
jgi:UDP-glucose 4-epimerase